MPGIDLEAVPLADKVAVLSRPETYGAERPEQVLALQTHMAWLFFTERRVRKLKKPVRYAFLDFGTVARRRAVCEAEVRLNRRLAADVYHGLAPLTLTADHRLRLGPYGEVVDWLVVMRRLPEVLMLDRLLRAGGPDRAPIERLGTKLAAFYAGAPRAPLTPEAYRERLRAGLEESARELRQPAYGLGPDAADAALGPALEFLERARPMIAARVAEGRIVEGHGDLRPEHICLEPEPVVIDCLEFNRALRLVDPLDELAYLALECELLGDRTVGERLIACYAAASGDAVPERLLVFYCCARALLRARLMALHSHEPGDRPRDHYLRHARAYLDQARRCADALP